MATNDYHFISNPADHYMYGSCNRLEKATHNRAKIQELTGFDIITQWWVESTLKEVNEIIGNAPDLVRWWPSVYLDVQIVEPGNERGLGDFDGRGIWKFEQEGPWVNITYDWKIRAEKPMLRYFSFLVKPIFAANHRWAMAKGEESLRLELARRHAATAEQRALIPAPPQPTTSSIVPLLLGTTAVVGALGGLFYLFQRSLKE